MYCHNCGKEISGQAKYCVHCGAAQNAHAENHTTNTNGGTSGGNNKKSPVKTIVAIAAIFLIGGFVFFGGNKEDDAEDVQQTAEVTESVEITEAAAQAPEDGWFEADGNTYYYNSGEKVTGLQEINNHLYYFYEDGAMAVNTDVDFSGNILEAGRDGALTGVTFARIAGEWSAESYRFGNGGTSSILELDMEVENCDYMTLYIEANGQRGANVSGTWKFYVRSNGSWVHVEDISYGEPSGSFKIRFDRPMDFDAITAYPTKQGNASYSSLYMLFDVHMGL